jgi:beta-xylosidase
LNALVKATFSHLIERYSANEVTSWSVEVWNKSNLNVFGKALTGRHILNFFRKRSAW